MGKRLIHLMALGLVLSASHAALAGIIVAEKLLVDLRAEDLPYGVVGGAWINHGTLADFTAVGAPVVEDVAGRKCVTFDGSSHFQGPSSSPGLEGRAPTSSIEIWVYNPEVPKEESMVSWAHRGGPDGTNMAFNYGYSPDFGAVGHWGDDADIGWEGPHSPYPEANNWWYLVYTHDGTTTRLYVNGEFEAEEDQSLNTHGGTPIRVAAQADNTGNGVNASYNFTGSIAEVRIHDGALSAADIANNFVSKPGDPVAGTPDPEDGQLDVLRDAILSWEPGPVAATHDVYLGPSFDDVNSADRTNPLGVLVSQDQAGTSYAPEGVLEFGRTYYWRVDGVNAPPDSTIFTGDVWSFTVEPLAYPVENIIATSNAVSEPGAGPEKTVDGSGLNADDQHSTMMADMWYGSPPAGEVAYIQYEFDRVRKLHELRVWNYNVMFEPILGYGFKDVTVEYSVDGVDWAVLKEVQFAQATARKGYTANTVVDLEGVAAQYVRLTANSGYGAAEQVGLSEVRILAIPVQPREPEPADGAADVSVDSVLTWRTGREASAHEVYLGTDAEALTLVETVSDNQYDPGALDLGMTYFWQISEVNEAEALSVWQGPLWSFATQDFVVVDDFDSYDDDDNRIFDRWLDGWSNDTGSTVGYLTSPFAEQTIVHSGRQSMPLAYDNTGEAIVSETEYAFDAAQNWTEHGIKSLSLYFFGDPGNSSGQLYVKVDGTKVPYDGSAEDLKIAAWMPWVIDLAALDVQNVTTLTIGIEGAGAAGILLIDDIRLSPHDGELVESADPGAEGLVAYYPLDGDAGDAAGSHDGTVSGTPDFVAGCEGQALDLASAATTPQYVAVAYSDDFALNAFTVAAWINVHDLDAPRAILGTRFNSDYTFDLKLEATRIHGDVGDGSAWLNTSVDLVAAQGGAVSIGDWHHIACAIDGDSGAVDLYLDGVLAATISLGGTPLFMKPDQELRIGHCSGTEYMNGLIDEVRIYNRALSPAEVASLTGRPGPFYLPF